MKDRFSIAEMKEIMSALPEMSIGQTINTHHCRDGDKNDRLYVTRNPDVTLFYCHHCGKSGALREAFARYKQHKEGDSSSVQWNGTRSIYLPSDVVNDVGSWPVKGRFWIGKACLTAKEISDRGIGYSPRLDAVILPIYFKGKLRGWQARPVGEKEGPKYLTTYTDKSYFLYHIHNPNSEGCVIVEDVLSCIKVARHKSCVAMLGSGINEPLFSLLTSEYDKWWLWSDYDNPSVKIQAHKAAQRLRLFGDCELVVSESDPKELTDEEIKRCLKLPST